jgi:hypothetical protein
LEVIVTGVAVTLISTAIVGAWRRRDAIKQAARERLCRREWEPIDINPAPGAWFVTHHDEWCRKCGARR